MEEKRMNRFTTKIGPREFTITGHKSHRHMQEVSDQINQDLDELGAKAPHLGLEERALLVSINAVSDLLDQTTIAKEATKAAEKANQEFERIQARLYELEALVDELIHDRDAYKEQTDRLFNENSRLVQQLTAADADRQPPKTENQQLAPEQQQTAQATDTEKHQQGQAGGSHSGSHQRDFGAETQAILNRNSLYDKKQPWMESPKRLSGLSKTPRH